jgi:hypothetical protein
LQSVLTTMSDQKVLTHLSQLLLAFGLWLAAILGVAMVAVVGVPKLFLGNTSILLLLFGGFALVTTLWMLATGIWVARRAW